ncbi:MAG: Asp23/Gls24 family envelope stress response protein [Chloroflexota bacterium]
MAEQQQEVRRAPGTTTIAPGVLVRIAQLAAISVPGVSSLAPVPGGVNRLFRSGSSDGVRVDVDDNRVSTDLFLTLSHGVDARKVSRDVQRAVARAIEDMVGMQVECIDVHIQEIDFEQPGGGE